MAHRYAQLASWLLLALATPQICAYSTITTAADQTNAGGPSVTLVAEPRGSVVYSYLQSVDSFGRHTNVSTRRPIDSNAYCFWSVWRLDRVNTATRTRTYAVYIFDSCHNDQLVYPSYANNNVTCYEDDVRQHPTSHASLCVDLPERHVPAGLTPTSCNALSEVSVALGADVSPQTYDASKPTTLTVTTSFASDFLDRLREGTCTDVLSWQDIGWTIRWPDGATTSLPGTGHDGVTATHTVAPAAGLSGPTSGQVTAVAHLHISGDALDFDPAGNLVTVRRDAFVDVSNRTSANGSGSTPVYAPPQLRAAARPAAQRGDGSIPPPTATPLTRVATIRGRLLDLFPDVVVVRPGTESVGGVIVGQARSDVTGWTYTGAVTDAPPGEGALPGESGGPGQPVGVQYDHAERLDALGNPVDEQVPLRLDVRTTYPDGHVETQVLTGSVAVSIYYTALSDTG